MVWNLKLTFWPTQHNLEKEGAYKGAFLSHKRGNLERLACCTRGHSASSSAVTQPPQQRRPSYGHYPTDATTLNPKGKTERRTDLSMFVFFTDTQTVLVSKAYNRPWLRCICWERYVLRKTPALGLTSGSSSLSASSHYRPCSVTPEKGSRLQRHNRFVILNKS